MEIPKFSDPGLLDEIIEDSPTTLEEIEKLQVYKILIILAAYIALGIGTLHFILSLGSQPYLDLLFKLFINLLFGFLLLISFHRIDYMYKEWAIMAIIFSVILISLGGIVGLLAGTFSIFGVLLSFLSD
ncbi:MAG: hypothetical protein R6W73_03145 [Candidatus Saliniplasma sp.]